MNQGSGLVWRAALIWFAISWWEITPPSDVIFGARTLSQKRLRKVRLLYVWGEESVIDFLSHCRTSPGELLGFVCQFIKGSMLYHKWEVLHLFARPLSCDCVCKTQGLESVLAGKLSKYTFQKKGAKKRFSGVMTVKNHFWFEAIQQYRKEPPLSKYSNFVVLQP